MMAQSGSKTSLALLVALALSGCNFFDSELVAACEANLKKRLRSPSEYDRVEINRSETKLDRNAFSKHLAAINSTNYVSTMRDFDSGQISPVLFTLLITYDAPNAHGTLIRGIARCEYVNDYGDDSRASEIAVSIDGQTYMEWLIEGMMKAAGN